MENAMEMRMQIPIDPVIWQSVTGRVESVSKDVKITEDFIKKVVKETEGKIYFRKDDDRVRIVSADEYYEVRNKLYTLIHNYVINQIKSGVIDGFEINADTIDLSEAFELYWRKKEEVRIKMAERERDTQIRDKIKLYLDKLKEKGIQYSMYFSSVELRVNNQVVRAIHCKYIHELLEVISKLSVEEVLRGYISKLQDEIRRLQRELDIQKEKIIKELYEKDETVTISDECTKVLRVVEDED